MVALCTRSVAIRRARTNSRAVLESRPRVELRNQLSSPVRIVNAIDSLVPRGDQTSGTQSFTNSMEVASKKSEICDEIKRYTRNTLLFTSTYSSYSRISKRRILDVVETENSGTYIGNHVSKLTP